MSESIRIALLRGICQLPAYVAHEKGFFRRLGLDSTVSVSPTAWMIPDQLSSGAVDFAVIPWTRVAASERGEAPLKVLCGSGCEEAAMVVRHGFDVEDVRSVAIPREGGMKDLTAMGLLAGLGWDEGRVELRRFPSGDGAIICFMGLGADAASMVEPYAAMMEELGVGRVVSRTGDLWPGVPGCSLATSARLIEEKPALVQQVVDAYVAAAAQVEADPEEAAAIGAGFIGVHPRMLTRALRSNRPNVLALRHEEEMKKVLHLMQSLGYVSEIPQHFADHRFLDQTLNAAARNA
jgi:ABC-type nitrate/sulfonate/bicarbonate transport system substrate-binding protein